MRIWIDKAGKAKGKEKGGVRETRDNIDGTKLVTCLVGRSREGMREIMLDGLFCEGWSGYLWFTRLAPPGGARGWK